MLTVTHLDLWLPLLEVPAHACQGGRAHTTNEDVDLALCILPDLWAGGLIVNTGVVRVLKLLQYEGVGCGSSNLLGLGYASLYSCNKAEIEGKYSKGCSLLWQRLSVVQNVVRPALQMPLQCYLR